MPRAKFEGFGESFVKMAAFGRTLGHPARILILRHLAWKGELTYAEVLASLPLSQPSCSRHIAELTSCGLVKARQEGRHIFMRVDRRALDAFCRAMSRTLHPPSISAAGRVLD